MQFDGVFVGAMEVGVESIGSESIKESISELLNQRVGELHSFKTIL